MSEKQSEGIVLKSIPYKDSDRILSVFTPDRGVISLYVGRISKSRPAMVNLTTPLCRAEFIFRKGRSDLHRFVDGTILDLNLKLRRSYQQLEYAGKMLNAILTSQMPGKSAPALYVLLTNYLKRLSDFPRLDALWASFQLKLLKHEGLLSIETACNKCQQKKASHIVEGESRCTSCASEQSYPFGKDEWRTLLQLFEAKQFDSFKDLKIDPILMQGIEALYHSRMEN